jgi:hypothetical protein
MPPLNWPTDPSELIRSFETRHRNPTSGALFAWATRAVESLHYLDDIDRAYDTSNATIGGHRADVVDVAHAQWATATSITALDLCAAGLGRAFCQHKGTYELALAHFDPNHPRRQRLGKGTGCLIPVIRSKQDQRARRRAQLPSLAREWIDVVCADPQYRTIKQARNWLTHSRVPRHFTLAAGGPPQRLQLELGTRVGVRQLIEDARDCATRYVAVFLEKLPEL